MAQLKPHVGAAIMNAADTYPKIYKVILECVQNAMDAGAINIWIDIDWKKRRIDIYDDGEGVTPEKFHRALATVGRTIKDESDVYGRFGRGLVAPLGKCTHFTFTSNGIEWTFNTADIEDSEDVINIPEREVDNFFSRTAQKNRRHADRPNWRTRVSIFNVVKNARIANFNVNDLIDEALTSFRTKMIERDTVLHTSVTPIKGDKYTLRNRAEPYSGTKLDFVRYDVANDKAVEFNMYLSLKIDGDVKGQVSVGTLSSPFRVPFGSFANSAVRDLLDSEVLTALSSGVFEGEILSNALTLHPERTHFVDDDGLVDVCLAVEQWYSSIGRLHYQEALSREDSERFERAAEKALDALSKLFEDPSLKLFADIVDQFPLNLDGVGANTEGDGEPHEVPAKTTKRDKTVQRGGGGFGGGSDTPGPSKGGTTRKGNGKTDTVKTKVKVPDPSGRSKTTVKSQQFGLRLGETEYLPSPWQLDLSKGVLWINTKHDLYLRCADSRNPDRAIRLYQQQVAIQALSLHCAPGETREYSTEVLDTELTAYVTMLTQ